MCICWSGDIIACFTLGKGCADRICAWFYGQVNVEKAYAFAEFITPEDATVALAFDGVTLHGTTLKIRRPKDFIPPAVRFLEHTNFCNYYLKSAVCKIWVFIACYKILEWLGGSYVYTNTYMSVTMALLRKLVFCNKRSVYKRLLGVGAACSS
jgi:hypothetical protein